MSGEGATALNYRAFGRSGWSVSEIGYGMWGMGDWTGSDDEESLRSLQLAVDRGCNFFDTAWAYGDGHSEELLGRLLRQNPELDLKVATKVPPKNLEWPSRREFPLDACYPPEHIEEYVQRSLDNLQVDKIDLLQLHTWEDRWVDEGSWRQKLNELRDQGLIELVGISLNRWEPWNGVRAVRSGMVDAVQVIYNIFDQSPEDELLPACAEMNVAIIARVPFDEGTLTGNLSLDSSWPEEDWRNTYFVPENLRSSVERAEALKPTVPAGMSMAEMALRFILGDERISTIIPGMRKGRHVTENMIAGERGPLPPELQAELKMHRWDREPTEWSQ